MHQIFHSLGNFMVDSALLIKKGKNDTLIMIQLYVTTFIFLLYATFLVEQNAYSKFFLSPFI